MSRTIKIKHVEVPKEGDFFLVTYEIWEYGTVQTQGKTPCAGLQRIKQKLYEVLKEYEKIQDFKQDAFALIGTEYTEEELKQGVPF